MSDVLKITSEKRKVTLALLVVLMLMITLTACQAVLPPQEMAGTVSRVDSILRDFDRYHEAIFTDAEPIVVEEMADRVMGIFRNAFVTDWLEAMQAEHVRSGGWGVGADYLITLIGSRVAAARNADDDRYEAALAEADSLNLNETQAEILQRIHASIGYFENQ